MCAGDSRSEPVGLASTQDLNYMQASNVNVSNNYKIWRRQMLCLIETQDLIHILYQHNNHYPGNKYDKLVHGWILATLNDQLCHEFASYYYLAGQLWRKLEQTFQPTRNSNREDSLGFKFENQLISDVPEMEKADNIRRERLYDAVVEGCWWKAKSILKIHKNAASDAITRDGNTILHLAVEMGHNYFVEKLLEFLEDGIYIEKRNNVGRTALHIAAVVGNTHAAQLLIKKREELFGIQDDNAKSPLDSALSNIKLNISAYLLKAGEISDLSNFSGDQQQNVVKAICVAISTKQYGEQLNHSIIYSKSEP
ncbi:putative ankyrin repeat-containing domain-containing protein [Helianthus anomalus]